MIKMLTLFSYSRKKVHEQVWRNITICQAHFIRLSLETRLVQLLKQSDLRDDWTSRLVSKNVFLRSMQLFICRKVIYIERLKWC